MMADWKIRTEAIIIGLLTNWGAPLIVAAGLYIGNTLSSGFLIHLLGGVTKQDIAAEVAKFTPDGAVVAFDLPSGGCPEGWKINSDAVGSAIVGIDKSDADGDAAAAIAAASVTSSYSSVAAAAGAGGAGDGGASSGTPSKIVGTSKNTYGNKLNKGIAAVNDRMYFELVTTKTPTYLPLFYCIKGAK
jgi:hypothetical protein